MLKLPLLDRLTHLNLINLSLYIIEDYAVVQLQSLLVLKFKVALVRNQSRGFTAKTTSFCVSFNLSQFVAYETKYLLKG